MNFYFNLPESLYILGEQHVPSQTCCSAGWPNDPKNFKSPGALLAIILILFSRMSSSHDRWATENFSWASQPLEGMGHCVLDNFFFNTRWFSCAHFAIGLLSDTHFSNSHSAAYTSLLSTDASRFRSHQLFVTDTLMLWAEVSRKREVAFFPWMAEKSPRPHIQSAIKVFHSFLPDISHICFFLSPPTVTTVLQDSTGSCLGGCCNSLLLPFLPLAPPLHSPRKTQAAFPEDFSSLPCFKASRELVLNLFNTETL